MAIRSPIVSVLGHVDHGKSSILDSLRGSKVAEGEAGGITQAIGASIMPLETIKERCGDMLTNLNITIPGLLFVDTPGHAAFTSLRKRGGSLADIAVVVVDINEGFQPQTLEAIEILKNTKTPFVIAANKVDVLPGFRKKGSNFMNSLKQQSDDVKEKLDNKIYEIVGSLHENFSLMSDRYDRVSNYTNQVAIIPCSATESVGIEELLMIITGLAQKYLEKNLNLDVSGPGKGVILEVKETLGMGKTLDVILHNGSLKVGDEVVVGGVDGAIVSKIKSIMTPHPLNDMMDKKSKYKSVKKVEAATGVKICLSKFDESIASGMPLLKIEEDKEESLREVNEQIESVEVDTDKDGVIVKADTIGSLEAMLTLLREHNIPIRKAKVGNITKKDVSDAESVFEENPLHAAILGFNVKEVDSTSRVKIIVQNIIYSIIDKYLEWQEEVEKELTKEKLEKINKPCKVEVLRNCIFRQSNPCIAGMRVLEGTAKNGVKLMNEEGSYVTYIKSMQEENDNVKEVTSGKDVAAQLPGVMAGRHINEGDVLYADLYEEEFRELKKNKKYLSKEELSLLKEIAIIKRKHNSLWGV